ncbi:DUF4468 domain-containing protein [Aegicerativicinus sediminis]|uniref:DUF4468 domain-containing protein n=1 Tax=Aegicerativicinus sediminis TaxID=2893202 RepID=UPI001E3A2FC6|nr:DUF4468 domain-containing protein [Aegicerativicinus sediminis]
MKTLILTPVIVMIFLYSGISLAQQYYDDNGSFHYREVFELEGKSQEQLYNSVKKWIAVNFNDANNVIKMDSKDQIIVKGLTSIQNKGEVKVDFTLDIAFKEGRYKLEMYDLDANFTVSPQYPTVKVPTINPDVYTVEDYKKQFIQTTIAAGGTEKMAMKSIDSKKFSDKYWPDAQEYNRQTAKELKKTADSFAANIKSAAGSKKDDW